MSVLVNWNKKEIKMKFRYVIAAVCMASFFVGCGSSDCGCKSQAASAEKESVQLDNAHASEGKAAQE